MFFWVSFVRIRHTVSDPNQEFSETSLGYPKWPEEMMLGERTGDRNPSFFPLKISFFAQVSSID